MRTVAETSETSNDARASALLQGLHHAPVALADLRDVIVVAEGEPAWVIPHELVSTVAAQLGGPELARELEAVPYEPGHVRVVVLVGRAAAVTTIAVRQMQAGGEA